MDRLIFDVVPTFSGTELDRFAAEQHAKDGDSRAGSKMPPWKTQPIASTTSLRSLAWSTRELEEILMEFPLCHEGWRTFLKCRSLPPHSSNGIMRNRISTKYGREFRTSSENGGWKPISETDRAYSMSQNCRRKYP
jgi:hypothetical protein